MDPKRYDRIIQLVLFSLMILFSLLIPVPDGVYRWAMIIPLVSIVVYFALRRPPLFGPCLFLFLCYLFRLLPVVKLGLMLIIPIIVYVAIVFAVSKTRRETTWLVWGKVTPRLVAASVVVVVVSSAALVLWYRLMRPDIQIFTQFFPDVEFWQLLVGGLGFAVINAVVEETVYRGIVWEGLAKLVRPPWGVLIIQAVFFGTAHIWGVPNGIVGVGLAFIYGVMLGIIRMWAGGLLMPIVTHVFADIVIFLILLDIIGRI